MTKMQSGILGISAILLAGFAPLWADGDVAAITKPSKDITLSFVQPGQIAKVLIKEGQLVKVGQPLVQQDDAAEMVQLAQLKAKADDTLRIKAAKAQLDQKKVELKKIQWAAKRGAATGLEVEKADLDVLIAKLSLDLSKFEHAQDARKFAETRIRVLRMRLTSPIVGKVEQIHVEAGESVDALEKVIRVVNINPLWIDVPVPLVQAHALKKDQAVWVNFAATSDADRRNTIGKQENAKPKLSPDSNHTGRTISKGKIVHVSSVADAASNTLMIRVEVANPTSRPAGEHVRVSFKHPDKKADSVKVSKKASPSQGKIDNTKPCIASRGNFKE